MPHSSRRRIARAFASLRNKQVTTHWKKHDTIHCEDRSLCSENHLIANRGEIACASFEPQRRWASQRSRCIPMRMPMRYMCARPAKRLHIDLAPSNQSYIVIDKILDAIPQNGC